MELKYSSLHKQLFDFLDKNFIFYPSWGNPDGRGNPDGWGNPDGFFGNFHRPDYPNTPVMRSPLGGDNGTCIVRE